MPETITWLALTPVDTLTFRGAEAMVAGESHEAVTLFPPLPSTFIGAVRTVLLRQKEIVPHDYLADSEKYAALYPLLGLPEKPGFNLLGPMFYIQGELFLPAPVHWFRKKDDQGEQASSIQLQAARPLPETCRKLGLCGSVKNPFWVLEPVAADLESLSGCWVSASTFAVAKESPATFQVKLITDAEEFTSGTAAVIDSRHLYDREVRFGTALKEKTRLVREGHLFASQHIRLKDGVRFIIGIEAPSLTDLADQEILQLGGEQRICNYRKVKSLFFPENGNGDLIMALSPIPFSALPEEFFENAWAGGKLLRVGGWDMQKNFHKDMVTYYPAGTVFQVSENSVLPSGFIRL